MNPFEDPVTRVFFFAMGGMLGVLIFLMLLLQGMLFYIKVKYRMKFGKWPDFKAQYAKIKKQVERNGRPDFGKVEIIEETP